MEEFYNFTDDIDEFSVVQREGVRDEEGFSIFCSSFSKRHGGLFGSRKHCGLLSVLNVSLQIYELELFQISMFSSAFFSITCFSNACLEAERRKW